MDKISVIIPIYNSENYLEECLDSVLNQTYPSIEVILVDDGSEDNSLYICKKYHDKYSNVVLVHQTHSGVSVARNRGLELATGDFYAFVDSDDYCDISMFEKMHRILSREESDMVICNYTKISDSGDILHIDNTAKTENANSREALSWINRSHGWTYVVVWNRLYRRELFENLWFTPGKIHEDEIIAHKIYARCTRISSIGDSLYYYRSNPNSITGKKRSIENLDGFDAVCNRYWEYKKLGYTELLSGTLECIKQFLSLINEIDVNNNSDKIRIRRMKKDFRLMVKDLGNKAGIINKIIAISPGLYYRFRNVFRGEK